MEELDGIAQIMQALADFNPEKVSISDKSPIDKIPEWGGKVNTSFSTTMSERVHYYSRRTDNGIIVKSYTDCTLFTLAKDGTFVFNKDTSRGTNGIASNTYLAWILLSKTAWYLAPKIKAWLEEMVIVHTEGVKFHRDTIAKLSPYFAMDTLGGDKHAT